MKKCFVILYAAAIALLAACNPNKEAQPVTVGIQLMCDNEPFTVADIKVTLQDAAGSYSLENATDASGLAQFTLKPGAYSAICTYVTSDNGQRLAYNGAIATFTVLENTPGTFDLNLQYVISQQIVVKELYFGGCNNPETNKGYNNDSYLVLYNNSDVDADASNVVVGFLAPYNSFGTNKFMGADGTLSYEKDSWIPAYGAIWWFTAPVTIPAYSQIVVALFGAIDHSATVSTSVNLSNSSYYWMSNSDVAQYTNAKYTAVEAIPTTQYLSCLPFTQGNAWALSNSSPALFIGNAPQDQVKAVCADTEQYDHTMGDKPAFNVVKFPKANVIGALEVFSQPNLEKSAPRFPADINTGYVAVTNNQGYSVYRNVDKAATEALKENEGKLVYNYALGTTDVEGTTDPSGIDAEASIANGAHILYSQTGSTTNDFHQRKTASLKK
ncbi:MAG: DUF4876 domain-containing protein [Bacteroidales bacterium]|nr:DUF4876 domain-containing protein [Bacteroidales bacterium]